MKKIAFLFAAVMLCLTAAVCLTPAASAEIVPSMTTGDLMKFEVSAENLPENSGFFVRPVATDEAEYRHKIEICQNEITVLAESKSVTEYFGEVRDARGKEMDLSAVLDTEALNVHEFCPFIAGLYEESYGKVTAQMLFATPYKEDEKVIVMIGLVTENRDGAQTVEWVAYEGVGVKVGSAEAGQQGCIQVELDAEIVMAVQEGEALMAVVSAGNVHSEARKLYRKKMRMWVDNGKLALPR